jgi:Zn finger protein HypA/HybF involved in hydrogenase expression
MSEDRIPFWEETDVYIDEEETEPLYLAPSSHQCHDCGAEPGELHMDGCDVEQCPECGRQLITCPHGNEILENALP